MRVNVILVLVILGLVDAARRRDRRTTTPSASLVEKQFAGQPEDLLTLWNHFDSHKLNVRAGTWQNDTSGKNRIALNIARQYPGLPSNPSDTNELPNPISPPVEPTPPPYEPPPGCLGPRGQYLSLKSCANYLNCWDDVVVEQTCPTGLLFNDVAGYCDFPFNVNCGDRPPATPKPPLPAGSKLCPDPNGRYRSSTNCSEFYVCAAGKPIKFNCPLGLVYSDILNVCDYQHNVDCKGTATPKPLKPTQSPTQSPQPSSTYAPINPTTRPPKPSTYPPQQPTYQPQPPTYQPQPPTYQPQPPNYQPQPPNYQPQPQPPTYQPQPPAYQPPTQSSQPPEPSQPTYSPQSPTYAPQPPSYQPYPSPPSSYGNSWLNNAKSNPWQQRNLEIQQEIDKEIQKEEVETDSPVALDDQSTHDAIETSDVTNPSTLPQITSSELMKTPCHEGEVFKLNQFCTRVVICKNGKPELIQCSPGLSYDIQSNGCVPFHIADCEFGSTPASQ
ncbi:protein transport protein SEC31 [Monomorium pharaonis]|uniref:protein transport protein SEC31 n=1 Tax=Monomorium pharaonis TaxID=307658 RepID=UPI00063EFB31|nr:protein transport protein SEC31 [Monomorium pharaonis]